MHIYYIARLALSEVRFIGISEVRFIGRRYDVVACMRRRVRLELVRKEKGANIFKKKLFSTMDFSQIWYSRLSFYISGFAQFSSNFNTVLVLLRTILYVLFGRHTIFQYFLVKSDVHSGYTVAKMMPNIKIIGTKSRKLAHMVLCTYYSRLKI